MASLNLITRMSLVPVVIHPRRITPRETYRQEWVDADGLNVIQPFEPLTLYDFAIEDQRDPLGNVTVDVTVQANLAPPSSYVAVFVNGTFVEAIFGDDGLQCEGPQNRTVTISPSRWMEIKGDGGDPVRVGIKGLYALTTIYPCLERMARFSVGYEVARDATAAKPAYCTPVTRHKTLVASRTETPGVPHYHYADWAVNRRTGKLMVVSESVDQKKTLSGGGVAPHDAGGNQIPTRPLPGSFESVTTGELAGSAMRFKAVGQCDLA